MTALIKRSYQADQDFAAVSYLVNLCAAFDRLGEDAAFSEFQFRLNAPDLNLNQDTCLITSEPQFDGNPGCIGVALIQIQANPNEVEGYLWIFIHPVFRGQGFDADLIRWGESRLLAAQEFPQRTPILRIYTRTDQSDWNTCLAQQNFSIERQFFTMVRTTDFLEATDQWPSEFTLSSLAGSFRSGSRPDLIPELSLNATSTAAIARWIKLYNEAFANHWNHHLLTLETVQYWQNQPDYRPELDLVAISAAGEFAAFCSCRLKVQNPTESIGWIEWLGTHRQFRRLGLGRSMVLAGLSQLKEAGATLVKLSVDSRNPKALHLYESIGFQVSETWLSWAKPLDGWISAKRRQLSVA
ncbi:MAG: GNAT family N-acetyltransferase [Oscillatoriales cyanobacterium RM2_1_1]|nr:GNAT family N-acetyltransferase [Oscillatoriales cyanobacterium SM2_3_0]NJO45367.1 GNAT family N-acetyltransferase [Oscillatoriales cyanobacterium RM2_1_1]